MIDKNLKNQYKSIKAPADLKDRILEATEATAPVSSKKRAYKYAQLIAACLVAVLCIGFVGAGLTSSTVYVDGNAFYGEAISVEKVSKKDYLFTKLVSDKNLKTRKKNLEKFKTMLNNRLLEKIKKINT